MFSHKCEEKHKLVATFDYRKLKDRYFVMLNYIEDNQDLDTHMDFMRECALRLDAGEPAPDVLCSMKERYTTVQCLNVKTCIVRKMCSPSSEYTLAFDAICNENPDMLEELKDAKTQHKDARTLLNSLPPKWSDNVRELVISRTQMVQCKRLAARNAMYKNSKKIR